MTVPDDLRRTITAWAGPAGVAWLDALPSIVRGLAERWSLTVGEPYVPSGYTALVLRVTTADGTPAALKVGVPDDDPAPEGAALRHYGGRATVALLAEEPAEYALLLERCDPGTPLTAEPETIRLDAVAGLLRELWSLPDTIALPRMDRWFAVWSGLIDTSALPQRDEAREVLTWLAATMPDDVVLHGDLHAANVLRATRRPWLAIDPKGLVGDPAYDTAAVVRNDPVAVHGDPVDLRSRVAYLAGALDLDPARVRGWTLVKCVEGEAWSRDAGDTNSAKEFAEAAALVAAL